MRTTEIFIDFRIYALLRVYIYIYYVCVCVNFPCLTDVVYSRVLSMVHSAAIWVHRALELTALTHAQKSISDGEIGCTFTLVAEQVRVRPTASG